MDMDLMCKQLFPSKGRNKMPSMSERIPEDDHKARLERLEIHTEALWSACTNLKNTKADAEVTEVALANAHAGVDHLVREANEIDDGLVKSGAEFKQSVLSEKNEAKDDSTTEAFDCQLDSWAMIIAWSSTTCLQLHCCM